MIKLTSGMIEKPFPECVWTGEALVQPVAVVLMVVGNSTHEEYIPLTGCNVGFPFGKQNNDFFEICDADGRRKDLNRKFIAVIDYSYVLVTCTWQHTEYKSHPSSGHVQYLVPKDQKVILGE